MSGSTEFTVAFSVVYGEHVAATVALGAEAHTCRCYDTIDGLGELASQLAWMLGQGRSQAIAHWEYAGCQTWWVLDRDFDQLDLNLVEFIETTPMLPGGRYVTAFAYHRCVFYAKLSFNEFVSAIVRAFDQIESDGADVHYSAWDYSYPLEAVTELRAYPKATTLP